jgi:uncharacterized protein YecE (DUF72 family)
MNSGSIRIGVSGWTYEPWRGVFYPKDLKREQELAYAASQFRCLEINATFYGLQRPDMFGYWADQVPAGFVFPVRGPRVITHVQRLRDPLVPLANFIASGLLRLDVHLGPILWQLPPNFRFQRDRIEPFLAMLPTDTGAAAALAGRHDGSLPAPPWLEPGPRRAIRHAFDVRHESFRCAAFIDLLRAYDVGLVCSDAAAWPRLMDVTADFVYCRLHGAAPACGYDTAALDAWARRIKAWADGEEPADAERCGDKVGFHRRDVFVVFDNDRNDRKVRAPASAAELMRRLRA